METEAGKLRENIAAAQKETDEARARGSAAESRAAQARKEIAGLKQEVARGNIEVRVAAKRADTAEVRAAELEVRAAELEAAAAAEPQPATASDALNIHHPFPELVVREVGRSGSIIVLSLTHITPAPRSLEPLMRALGIDPLFAIMTAPDAGVVGVETAAERDVILTRAASAILGADRGSSASTMTTSSSSSSSSQTMTYAAVEAPSIPRDRAEAVREGRLDWHTASAMTMSDPGSELMGSGGGAADIPAPAAPAVTLARGMWSVRWARAEGAARYAVAYHVLSSTNRASAEWYKAWAGASSSFEYADNYLQRGKYAFRVQGYDAAGVPGPWSETTLVDIR
jgi:hypothetical protein